MRRLAMVALVLTTFTATSYGQTEENRASANYLVPLCKTWLDFADKDSDTLQNMGRTEPVRLAAAGVCVGAILQMTVSYAGLQAYLGHRNIQNTARYTALAPDRFKGFGGTDCSYILLRLGLLR
jgi:hypothetical protein